MSLTAEFTAEARRAEHGRAVTSTSCARWRDHLALLLERAGRGDEDAFLQFYDLTSGVAYRAMRLRYDDPETAEAATHALYVRAWDLAPRQATSGLSPLAWLLSGPTEPIATAC